MRNIFDRVSDYMNHTALIQGIGKAGGDCFFNACQSIGAENPYIRHASILKGRSKL
jgi:hypothetical protein